MDRQDNLENWRLVLAGVGRNGKGNVTCHFFRTALGLFIFFRNSFTKYSIESLSLVLLLHCQ